MKIDHDFLRIHYNQFSQAMNFSVDPDTRASWESAWKEFDPTLNKKLNLNDLRLAFLSIGKDITQSMYS